MQDNVQVQGCAPGGEPGLAPTDQVLTDERCGAL